MVKVYGLSDTKTLQNNDVTDTELIIIPYRIFGALCCTTSSNILILSYQLSFHQFPKSC